MVMNLFLYDVPMVTVKISKSSCWIFFSLFKKPISFINDAIKLWALQMTIIKANEIFKLNGVDNSDYVVTNVYKKLRNLCSAIAKNKIKLGGPGKYVGIDESLVAKAKHNKGKVLKKRQTWIFGMVERGPSGRAFVQVVKDRKGPTLLKILYDHVEPGTKIVIDTWSSYNRISNLKNFKHLIVNHKYHFIDPDSGACTNKIEGLWNHAKRKFKDMNGCSRVHLKSYLDEFLWRHNNTIDRIDSYDKILQEIAYFFPDNQSFEFEKIYDDEEDEVSIFSIRANSDNEEEDDDEDDDSDGDDGTWPTRAQTQLVGDTNTSYERKMEAKIQSLDQELNKLNLKTNLVKLKSLELERISYEEPKCSAEADKVVEEVILAGHDLACELCKSKGIEKKCKGDRGLKLHISKSHKRK
ncbi:unnamed protein product [Brachionus calyciflorus]|uniref:ISXO2-like transposase domain-containing protein n=1 Tax=Brachionus calyciflorus TaxID=104777 RepID=A0A814FBM8_9BILA|nr:unnamed protein product [Brachionus calyciflorus]